MHKPTISCSRARSSDSNMMKGSSYEQLKGETGRTITPNEDVNPFYYKPAMTRLDWLKVVINTFWLFPLRLLFFVLPSFIMGCMLCTLVIIGDRLDQNNPEPLRGWRRFVINELGRRLDRFMIFGCGFHWITVKGTPATAAQAPVMVASPHSSVLDMAIISLYHLPTFVAKEEARSVPILGYLVTHTMRTIFVARDNTESKKECTDEIIRRAKDPGAGWPKILIFPEATTHSREVLLEFKKGAFLPGMPVQAVAIKYHNRLNTMVWSDRGMGLAMALYLTLCQFHNSLEVEFLPVHTPTSEEIADPGLFAENVRKEVSMATGIPCSNYTVEDMLICRKSEQNGLPYPTGLISFSTLHQEFKLSLSQVKKKLEMFSRMDSDKDGYITIDDFCSYLAVPNDACTQTIFKSLSHQAGDGRISFKQYVTEITRQSQSFISDQSLQQIFQFFDSEGNGRISLSDITSKLPLQLNPNHNDRVNSNHTHLQINLPTTMDYDEFCEVMRENSEYLLIFHECQFAAISSPPVTRDNGCHDNITTIQLES